MLPADLTLLFKTLITLQGLGQQYDPHFRLVERIQPFLDRALSERYQPVEALRRGQATLTDFFGMVTSVPPISRGLSKTPGMAACGLSSISSAWTASANELTAQSIA